MTAPKFGLSISTWTDVASHDQDVLLVPLGSTEQHGPHLPLDVDTRIAQAVAERAATDAGVHVAPALPYGSSGEHQGFEGTISIGTAALAVVIVELARSALLQWRHVIFVNGHGGNLPGARKAVDQLRAEGRSAHLWFPTLNGDAHAGKTETSVILHLHPELVRVDAIERGNTTPLEVLLPDLMANGLRPHTPTGVLGDPTAASADHGHAALAEMTTSLTQLITRIRAADPTAQTE